MQELIEDPKKLPKWLMLGRTVVMPKIGDLSIEKDYKPMMCLKTSYKVYTVQNDLWDKIQMETYEKVLGMVDQLFIDNVIMGEVRYHPLNFAVSYYDC